MPKPTLHVYNDLQDMAIGFSNHLIQVLKELSQKQEKITVGLSGGNTPKIIFKYLADNHVNSVVWEKVHFFWGDDRCVPEESSESNYGVAKRLFFDFIDIPKNNIHSVLGENNPEEEAKRYSEELTRFLSKTNGLPTLDINILGMGDDGHTASIFPYQIDLLNSDKICEVAAHPDSGQKRITITGKTLNNSKKTYFLIAGSNKAEVLKAVLEGSEKAKNYPTYFIDPENGTLDYFVDKAAMP